MMGYLIRFEDEQALDARLVGQKFCSLARAFRAGFAVPEAVAISTAAHRHYLANSCWPDGLVENVLNVAYALDISQGLSIRSSATREDLEKQSFAGQYRSFLQVVDKEDLKNNIEACWKSVSSKAVRSYQEARKQTEHPSEPPLMGVVIQKMVAARAAGIAFGRNPMKPSRKEIVIEAVKGLAEDLVSGHRTPFRAVVDENGGVRVIPPEPENRIADETDRMLRTYPFWRDIAKLVKDLESCNGEKPQDIEWAMDDRKKIWLLQSRAITTLGEAEARIPPGLWTRKIANDLWADRLTPFLAHHMVQNAHRFDHTRTLKILGILVIRPTLAVIEGYLYINGESIKKALSYLPPKLRLPEINTLLPSSVKADQLPGPSILRFFSVCVRSVLLLILEPGVNPILGLRLAKNDLRVINSQIDRVAAMPDSSPHQTMDKILAAMETLTLLQIKNQWPYFFATFTTWVLKWLVTKRLGRSHTEFLSMLSIKADNVSIDIEKSTRKLARDIARNKELADLFLRMPADEPLKNLPPPIRIDLNNLLSRYGCRSRHRTLFIKRWSESPGEVIGILQSLVRNQLEQDKKLPKRWPATGKSGSTWATIAVRGWPLTHLFLGFMTRITRRFLDLREESRFTLDRILYLIRRTLLTLGGQTGLSDKVMFLIADELQDTVTGKMSSGEARRKAVRRYEEFMRPFDVATYFNEGLAENDFQTDGRLIRGIGTSPGRVSGYAKIVDEPARADIQKGDILIAKNTDPGWTPIFSIVGGMVMEEGGLLNHCSIVARELGVPSIVGVKGATRRIKDNDRITIDGGLGVIIIED